MMRGISGSMSRSIVLPWLVRRSRSPRRVTGHLEAERYDERFDWIRPWLCGDDSRRGLPRMAHTFQGQEKYKPVRVVCNLLGF